MRSAAFSPVVLGLWPIAGVTSVGVTDEQSRRTIAAALDSGVNTFDTAFSYGYRGESDRLLGQMIAGRRDEVVVIGKVGQRWTANHQRQIDASPQSLVADAEESLSRIGIERFDLLMLHSVDPQVDIRTSAEAIAGLQRRGLTRRIGVCNVDFEQLRCFAEAAHPAAVQWPLNLLQRDILDPRVRWCESENVAVLVYWTLMKGILAGAITRDHVFAAGDSRPSYEIYKGAARERTHEIVDSLRRLAAEHGRTVSQLAIGWALSQSGVTAALVGAKRPAQIRETAAARPLSAELVAEIDRIVVADGS